MEHRVGEYEHVKNFFIKNPMQETEAMIQTSMDQVFEGLPLKSSVGARKDKDRQTVINDMGLVLK